MTRTSSDFSTLITKRSITVNYDGESHTVMKEASNYEALLSAIRDGMWDDIEGLLNPIASVPSLSNGEMRVESGQVYVKGDDGEFVVPSGLNETILLYVEQKLPFEPLVKFAVKLNQNPSYRSVQQLFNFIEKNQFTITEDGNFIAYKKVREDFKDYHTGNYDNSVGSVLKMPRNQVDENPDSHCSNGFHAGNYEYPSANFHAGSGIIVYVEIDPKDVVSVPGDFNNAKLRVCEYKVLGIAKSQFKEHQFRTKPEVPYSCDTQDDFEEEDEEERCYKCDNPTYSCYCCTYCEREEEECECDEGNYPF